MPFRSQLQKEKFKRMVKSGEISEETYKEWEKATGSKPLPQRVKRKPSKSKMRHNQY